MKISDARKKFLFTVRIEFPLHGKAKTPEGEVEEETSEKEEETPEKVGEETPEETGFVVLREPTIAEMSQLGKDESGNFELIKQLFPKCIIDHPFVNDDGTKTTAADVTVMLKASSSLYMYLIQTWFDTIPFPSPKEKRER
jgi:hypothetical protein